MGTCNGDCDYDHCTAHKTPVDKTPPGLSTFQATLWEAAAAHHRRVRERLEAENEMLRRNLASLSRSNAANLGASLRKGREIKALRLRIKSLEASQRASRLEEENEGLRRNLERSRKTNAANLKASCLKTHEIRSMALQLKSLTTSREELQGYLEASQREANRLRERLLSSGDGNRGAERLKEQARQDAKKLAYQGGALNTLRRQLSQARTELGETKQRLDKLSNAQSPAGEEPFVGSPHTKFFTSFDEASTDTRRRWFPDAPNLQQLPKKEEPMPVTNQEQDSPCMEFVTDPHGRVIRASINGAVELIADPNDRDTYRIKVDGSCLGLVISHGVSREPGYRGGLTALVLGEEAESSDDAR